MIILDRFGRQNQKNKATLTITQFYRTQTRGKYTCNESSLDFEE